jgi:predicted kinase
VILVGPSTAGKTTHAKRHYGADEIVSADALRVEIYGSLNVPGSQGKLFEEVHKRVHNRLSRGETVVVDATNLRQRDRLAIVDLAPPDIQVVYEVWTSCNRAPSRARTRCASKDFTCTGR